MSDKKRLFLAIAASRTPPLPQVELQSLVRIDLAVLGALRLMAQRQLNVGLVERLTCDQLIRPRRLHRVNGCRAVQRRSLSRIFREERLAKAERDQRNVPRFLGNNNRSCRLCPPRW